MVRVSFFLQKAAKAAESLLSGAATRKRLDVAIVGAPNAGKSQLLNALTGSSIAAVSRKRHTTRTDILGARTVGDTQIVFKDTPGYLRLDDAKEERLNRELIVNAASEMQNVDYTLLVVDAARTMSSNYQHALVQLMLFALKSNGRVEEGFTEEEQKSESPNEEQRPKFAVVLNKVDLVKPKSKLLDLAMEIGTMADACLLDHLKANMETDEDHQDENAIELDIDTMMDLAPITFYTSALANEGVDDVVDHLIELATPCKNWAVPAGQATDMSSEEQTQELIREKIYRCLVSLLQYDSYENCYCTLR